MIIIIVIIIIVVVIIFIWMFQYMCPVTTDKKSSNVMNIIQNVKNIYIYI